MMTELMAVFRPHRLYAVHRCGLLLQMSHVAWSVCLSVCWAHRCMSCAKRLNRSEYRLPVFLGGGYSRGSDESCINHNHNHTHNYIAPLGGGVSGAGNLMMMGKKRRLIVAYLLFASRTCRVLIWRFIRRGGSRSSHRRVHF